MSVTVSTLISDAQFLLDDSVSPDATEAIRIMNRARQEIARELLLFRTDEQYSSSSTTTEYALPTDCWQVVRLTYKDVDSFSRIDPSVQIDHTEDALSDTVDTPDEYWIDTDRYFHLPRLTAGAATTLLDGAVATTTTTTITVDDTGDFPTTGVVLIDSEEVYHEGKTSTTFTNCVRGYGGTTAATHTDDSTVTERDIELAYYKQPADLTVSASVEVVFEHNPDPLIYFFCWQAKTKDTDDMESTGAKEQAQRFYALYRDAVGTMALNVKGRGELSQVRRAK